MASRPLTTRPSIRERLIQATVCGIALFGLGVSARALEEPPHSAELDAMIVRAAKTHGVPERLVRRIVMRESRYNPRVRNHLYWGLMQISYPTARSMGFKGTPEQLLNPLVNLTYAVPYLANAFIIAGKHEDAAVRLYASGYYMTARQRGLLGVLRTAESPSLSGQPDLAPEQIASIEPTAAPQQSQGIFGSLQGAPAQVDATPPARPVPQSAQISGDPGGGMDMASDKKGRLAPPKKWLHDGGMTVIARGEQGIEKVAAYEHANGGGEESGKRSRHASRKNTTFAAIEAPPANAQAYAASASQDPGLAQTASQAAIAQATAGAPADQASADPRAAAALAASQAGAPDTADATADKPTTRRRRLRTAKKHHTKATSEVAQSESAAPPAASPPPSAAPAPVAPTGAYGAQLRGGE